MRPIDRRGRDAEGRGRGKGRGYKQRAAERRGGRVSRLAQYLLESFGFGLMFATEVQELASRAIDDHKEDGVSTSAEDLE